MPSPRTFGEHTGVPAHRSFFREKLAKRARPVGTGLDPVEEYLIDQANLRGFLGAFSNREDWGHLDVELDLEDVVVGLLQPHAPADLRIVKLVTRILQQGALDADRLIFRATRERALPTLAWIVDLIPQEECHDGVEQVRERLRRDPPRELRRPRLRYDAKRLLRPGR